MEQSLAGAGQHTRRIFGEHRLSLEEVEQLLLSRGDRAVIATADLRARPHASVGSVLWLDGLLYLLGKRDSRRHRNLLENPRVAIVVMEGWKRQALIEGDVRPLDERDAKAILDEEERRYGWRDDAVFVVEPRKIFTYRSPRA